MRRRAWAESIVGEHDANPANWPSVDISHLTPKRAREFAQRRRAVQLHLLSEFTMQQISEKVDLSVSEIQRLTNRCLEVCENGNIWGWYPLIPYARTKRLNAQVSDGRAGSFTLFLKRNPKLEKKLKNWALAKKPADGTKHRGRVFAEIWLAFRRACKDAGLDVERDYPFTNRDRGQEAIRRYCRQVRRDNFTAGAIAEYGTGIVTAAPTRHPTWDSLEPEEGPYHRVQFDGHRLDVDLVLETEDADGKLVP